MIATEIWLLKIEMQSNMTDQYIIPFGKHKGKLLSEVPHSWYEYMYFRNKLSGEIKIYAEENVAIIRFEKQKQNL
jgi:uncharacterized protein (DUF3820 family)